MSITVTVLLAFVAVVGVSAFDLSAIKPIAFDARCRAREPCAIHVANMEHIPTLGFCKCPGGNICPNDEQHMHKINGIRYQFCTPTVVPECARGDVAQVMRGLHTEILCACEAPYEMQSDEGDGIEVKYICDEPLDECQTGDTCQTYLTVMPQVVNAGRVPDTAVRKHCKCGAERKCEVTDTEVKTRHGMVLLTENAQCVPAQ